MYDITSSADSGRVIAVWSPVHRQGAVSTTTAMLASFIAEQLGDNNGKVLVMSNELHGAPTAAYYMTKERVINGLAEVIDLSNSDNLKNAEDIYNNTFSVSGKIDILNSDKRNTNVSDFLGREISNIFNVARRGYKYTIVDTVCGPYDSVTKTILKNCDTIVVCLPQDRYIFDSWIRKMAGVYVQEVESKPTLVLSALHYEYPDMLYRSMQKEVKGKSLYYISLNDIVHRAVSERNIPDMIKSNLKSKSHDDIIDELQAIYDKILENLENVIDMEVQNEMSELEETKKQTQEYLESTDTYFDDMGYEDEPDSSEVKNDSSEEDDFYSDESDDSPESEEES